MFPSLTNKHADTILSIICQNKMSFLKHFSTQFRHNKSRTSKCPLNRDRPYKVCTEEIDTITKFVPKTETPSKIASKRKTNI